MVRRVLLGSIAAGAAALLVGVDLSRLTASNLVPEWWMFGGSTGFLLMYLSVIIIAAGTWFAVSRGDVGREDTMGQVASVIQAFAVLLVFWTVWQAFDAVGTLLWTVAIAAGIYLALSVIFWYFQHRRQVRSAGPAIRRTQRSVGRSISNTGEFVIGIFILLLALVFALISGVLTALPVVGDILLPFAPEFAYLTTVYTGFVAMGGDLWGSWIVPQLTPMQWAGFSLIIAGIAMMIRR